ncbi:dihydrofolate reductase family protein [Dactylosporangium sp. NPDC000244]|uniref:dihydrofolate reductase family protein n=1 Tax=Dactylosporangium sp. NPDC000244 TaxID=3154365 RepID=UPI003320E6D4
MAIMLYSASMSLDGFIAGPGGDMSWLTPHIAPNPLVDDLIPRIGALIVGNRTFGGDDPHRGTEGAGKPFGGGWDGPQYVVTHHPRPDGDGITFVPDVETAVREAKAAAGDGYVNILGADIARQCLALGELDEILAITVPVLLGAGTRLFAAVGTPPVQLEQVRVTHTEQAINTWMRIIK